MLGNANVTAVVPGGKKYIPGISFPNNIKFLEKFPHKGWNRGTGATELSKENPGLSQPCRINTCAGNPAFGKIRKNQKLIRGKTVFRKSKKNQEMILGKPQGPAGG